jgi:hypothetical protein
LDHLRKRGLRFWPSIPQPFDPDLILLNMVTVADAADVVIVMGWTHAVAYHRVALGSILSALPRCDGSGPSRRITPRVAQLGGNSGGKNFGAVWQL